MAQAVSFDLDNTLLDSSGSRDQVDRRACNQLAVTARLDGTQLLEANRRVWQNYWPQVEEKWTLGVLSGRAVVEEAWRRSLLACGYEDEPLVRLASETYTQQRRNSLRLFDDVHGLLNKLKLSFRLALITNGASDTQRGMLRIFNLDHLFEAVVVSGEIGVAKPDPSVFALALEKLGVERENAWHVGDSLTTDVAGALSSGLVAVWINRAGVARKESDPKPDHEIRSLTELPSLLSARGEEIA